jgi:hypothetical protein
MVFIRPTILRDSIDSRFISGAKYNYLRNLQRELSAEPVRLMRDEVHPELPELGELTDLGDPAAAGDAPDTNTGTTSATD